MSEELDRTELPIRRPPFSGVANQTLGGSQPDWGLIGHVEAARRARRTCCVVLIDDAGFGNPSTFGGPIDTPNYDRMAGEGLRYNRFHVTAMCSPTRAALLTGRNHHAVGMGGIPEFSGGFPGYSAMLPRDAAPFPKVLKENGYSTAAIGKWHLTPEKEQGPAGPVQPLAQRLGLRLLLGLPGARGRPVRHDDRREPEVHRRAGGQGREAVLLPRGDDRPGDRLAARRPRPRLRRSRGSSTTRPGAATRRITSSKEWSDKYKGRFDQGWDRLREETFERQKALGVVPADAELTPRDELMPAWDSLSENSKRLFAHQMEVYAGLLGERRPPRRPAPRRDRGDGRARQHASSSGSGVTTAPAWRAPRPARFNEGTMVNGLPLTDEEQMQLTLKWGGLEAWGTEMMYPHYSTAWAWAGQHAVPVGQAGRLAPRRHPQPARRPLAASASRTPAACGRSSRT